MGSYSNHFLQLNCNDELLSAAYTFAEYFIFPSKYEGFGIPTLEAFSCGCPVVLSQSSSLPEVGGKAALYFEPDNVEELTKKIKMILDNTNLKEILVEQSKI